MKKCSVTIPQEVCTQIEALNYEKQSRFDILRYIKENNVDVSPEIREVYFQDYIRFSVQFENFLSNLVREHQSRKVDYYDVTVDFIKKELKWVERGGSV